MTPLLVPPVTVIWEEVDLKLPLFVFSSFFIFILGLCIGSFLNVCIYRLPRGQSLIHPPSHCPQCGNLIKWYDNIPLLSYLLLKGRCQHCSSPISFRYPLVEALTGTFFLFSFFRHSPASFTFPLSLSFPSSFRSFSLISSIELFPILSLTEFSYLAYFLASSPDPFFPA
jgi:prepilin signal peptidase PulO-like enzyme (type II secretory pathway)